MRMKKMLACLFFLLIFLPGFSQEKHYDTTAIVILDHMSAIIGDMNSCSFTQKIESDIQDPDLGWMTKHDVHNVWLSGPDKLLVESFGDKGHRGLWYNGQTLTWYSFKENNYVVIDVPGRTVDMIDSVYEVYGIEFPAADFFNPTLSDDLIELADNINFRGRTMVDGRSCFLIVAENKEMVVQLWISDEVEFLPVKMVIQYSQRPNEKRYEATFEDWQINPNLPSALFEFAVPPDARQISILPRK